MLEPLVTLATTDGTDLFAALDQEAAARAKLAAAGRFGNRTARKGHRVATEQVEASRARLAEQWGTTPGSATALTAWAANAAERVAVRDPRVLDAMQNAAAARAAGDAMSDRQRRERRELLTDIFGTEQVRREPLRYEFVHPDREAADATSTATAARTEVATLRDLPVQEAADRIEAQREATEHARLAREARARKLNSSASRPFEHDRTTPRRDDGPSRGL